jgi:hypothetical protein
MSSPEIADVPDAPTLADALPGAEHHCTRAVAHLEGRPARGDLLEALVALLEAAGGPDVGNVVRTHLERTGTTAPARCATDRGRVRVLAAAVRLHAAAERDLRDRLRSAGVVDHGGLQDTDGRSGRASRAQYAERVLRGRRSVVDRVVAALLGGPLPATGDGLWVDALVGALPPDLSHGETDRDAAAR